MGVTIGVGVKNSTYRRHHYYACSTKYISSENLVNILNLSWILVLVNALGATQMSEQLPMSKG